MIFGCDISEAVCQLKEFASLCEASGFEPRSFLGDKSQTGAIIINGVIHQGEQRWPTSVICVTIAESSGLKIIGRGRDAVGKYAIFGGFAKHKLEFVKKYDLKENIIIYRSDKLEHFEVSNQEAFEFNGKWKATSESDVFHFKARLFGQESEKEKELVNAVVSFEDVRVSAIRSVDMQFDAKVTTKISWPISTLDIQNLAFGVLTDPVLSYTPPMPKFMNGLADSVVCEVERTSLALNESLFTLEASCFFNCTGTFFEPFELQGFPLDCQNLSILMQFNKKSSEAPALRLSRPVEEPGLRVIFEDGDLPEFQMHPPSLEFSTTRKLVGLNFDLKAKIEDVQEVAIRLKVARKYQFYLLKIVVPLIIIEFCTTLGFFLPPVDGFADRLSYVSTMFLTAVAFQFIVSSFTPNLDYMTVLDKFTLSINCHVGLMLLQCCVVGFWEIDSTSVNLALILGNIILIPVSVVIFFFISLNISSGESKKLNESNSLPRAEAESRETFRCLTENTPLIN